MNRTTCLAYLGISFLVFVFATGCLAPDYVPVEDPAGAAPVQGAPGAPPAVATEWQPARETVEVPGRSNVIARWQLPPTSPWLAYQKFTLPAVLSASPSEVSLPEVTDLDDVVLAHEAGARVAAEGFPADAAFFVDLPGAASVSFARALSTLSPASVAVIPTFNNWPAEGELVPAEETLAAMIAMPPRLPEDDDPSARPVFLLDAWRLAYKEEVIADDVVDNRYMLTTADFPTAAALRAQGITQIVYVVASDAIVDEEDDLNELFAAYEEQGIVIYMLDVSALARARDGDVPWFVEASSHCFLVRHRRTIIHDPRFYRRAHGGFGGVQLAGPSGHVHGGGHGGGGGG